MFNLVYASLATEMFATGALLEWLPAFREKNARLGITGLLLYQDGAFMQTLEGDEAAVRALYATIREDPRHHRVVTLLATPVDKRQFPDWSLGFKSLDTSDFLPVAGYSSYLEPHDASQEFSWGGSVALCLLATFKLRANEGLATGPATFIPDPRRPRY